MFKLQTPARRRSLLAFCYFVLLSSAIATKLHVIDDEDFYFGEEIGDGYGSGSGEELTTDEPSTTTTKSTG